MRTKNILIILSLITSIMLFSGCTNYFEDDLSLRVSLLEVQLGNALNITSTDLSPYPTLQEALDMFFTPNNSLTYVHLKISRDEKSSILNSLLVENDEILNKEKYFLIGFIIS